MGRTDEWGTPKWLWNRLDEEFAFELDAAADPHNAKCAKYLGAGGLFENALAIDEWPGSPVFLNPPYARGLLIGFLAAAVREAERGRQVVALLPVRSDTDWWADYVIASASELRFIRRRVAFVPPPGHAVGQTLSNRPQFPSVVAVFGPGLRAGAQLKVATLDGRPVSRKDWCADDSQALHKGQQALWPHQKR